MSSDSVDLAMIMAARERIVHAVKRTPLVSSHLLSQRYGGDVRLKAENLQVTGSFKARGAINKLVSVGDAARNGVTAGSAGNHAQAIAYAAQRFGVPCEIFVPVGAPIAKINGAQSYGATVTEAGASVTESVVIAQARAEQADMVFCHPFDDPVVVAGQGTLGLELLADLDETGPSPIRTIIIPLGGGGLAAGTAIAVKSQHPGVRVVGVQADACPSFFNSVIGRPMPEGPITTLADGIAVKTPGVTTAPLVERWVDEIVTVDEDTIADAMVLLMDRAKLYVEGAGAVGVAALLSEAVIPADDGLTCVVLSGGNVDLGVVPGLIRRHESAEHRRLTVFARIDDRPGGLARFLQLFADGGANLLEVDHLREGISLHVRETGIRATFEVRSADHATRLVAAAGAADYPVEIDDL